VLLLISCSHAEKDALEPKEKPKEEADAPNGDAEAHADGDGDVSMSEAKDVPSRQASLSLSLNGVNGGTHSVAATERDELDDSGDESNDDDAASISSISEENAAAAAGAARRKAMAAKAAEREAAEAARKSAAAKEREAAKEKKAENKHFLAEKRRLAEEEEAINQKIRALELDFRSHMYTLRARPLGTDRYGNKVWWMDGLGSAPLVGNDGKTAWGTGRLFVQGVENGELEWVRLAAVAANEGEEVPMELVKERREKDEGGGKLEAGEWGSYETPEQVSGIFTFSSTIPFPRPYAACPC
jgi:hypothetical protein